jgi:3-oxosteroid 1-dehydrogenase
MDDYDVICVGAGLGGLAAAIRAHDGGASVLVLERSAMVGGVAAYSGGFVWVRDNYLFDGEDSIDASVRYLDHVQGDSRPVDRAARRRWADGD